MPIAYPGNAISKLARAVSGGGFESAIENLAGQGYIAFDVPLIEQATTGTTMTVRLVRREGVSGSVTVSVSAEDKFRPQGVQSYLGESVTFNQGDLTKTISVPLNAVTLDGEAHFYLRISGNSITYNDIRYHETNCLVVVDDGSEASDGVILTDPTTQIIQDNLADNTIVYVGAGTWDDASKTGYSTVDPGNSTGTIVIDKQNLVIRNRPGTSPVISYSGSRGFELLDNEYVHISGFEITQDSELSNGMPLLCENYLGTTDPTKFDNKHYYIRNNHIHHFYGEDNVGGVRLDDSLQALVFNNLIHDAYNKLESSNTVTAEPYGLHAGVHGYRPRGCTIYQNTFYHVGRAVFQKDPPQPGNMSHLIARNYAYNYVGGTGWFQHAGAGGDPLNRAKMYENISVGSGLSAFFLGTGASTSELLKIYNNTIVGGAIATLEYITGVQIWNNLVSGIPSSNRAFRVANDGGNFDSGVGYFDFNGYESSGYDFMVDDGAADQRTYADITSWQASTQSTGFNTPIPDLPDASAVVSAVTHTNAAAGDYTLAPASSAFVGAGRYGEDIGAYRLGHEQIGSTI